MCPEWPQKAQFEPFWAVGQNFAQSGPRRPILSFFGPWARYVPRVAAEAHFGCFGLRALERAKRAFRRIILVLFSPRAWEKAKSGPW